VGELEQLGELKASSEPNLEELMARMDKVLLGIDKMHYRCDTLELALRRIADLAKPGTRIHEIAIEALEEHDV
jgi:hypothetical protein